jgi:hypothetical protein
MGLVLIVLLHKIHYGRKFITPEAKNGNYTRVAELAIAVHSFLQ